MAFNHFNPSEEDVEQATKQQQQETRSPYDGSNNYTTYFQINIKKETDEKASLTIIPTIKVKDHEVQGTWVSLPGLYPKGVEGISLSHIVNNDIKKGDKVFIDLGYARGFSAQVQDPKGINVIEVSI